MSLQDKMVSPFEALMIVSSTGLSETKKTAWLFNRTSGADPGFLEGGLKFTKGGGVRFVGFTQLFK